LVSIVENWAIVVGLVAGITTVEPKSNFMDLKVEVQRVENLESYPNLINKHVGDEVTIRVQANQIAAVDNLVDTQVKIRVRRGRSPDILFAHPDWRPMRNGD